MNMQTNYDLFIAAKEEKERVASVHEKIKELSYA
jgi:hypothetical protein|nr:MAG TPA: hypothetical protein [Caudoviricetes sp.]